MPDESTSSPFTQHTLANGLRAVVEVMPDADSAACGFLVRTGSRDDPPDMAGAAHFLEHMMFKGTPRRTWEQINIAFDEMGSFYNAYTSRDRTFYHGWVPRTALEQQMELLADMMRSTLPPEEFETERNVVLEEIAMSNDELSSFAYDFLYEQACPGSSLAWPVLGWESTIAHMDRDRMAADFRRRYAPGNMVFLAAGDVDPDAVLRHLESLTGDWQPADPGPGSPPPALRSGRAARKVDRFHQQAVMLAFASAPAAHPLAETAEAAAAVLGGHNSRFYWNIVQKGLCTRAGCFHDDYADFGLTVMYALCEPENCEAVLEAMRREAENLARGGAEPKELQRVRNLRRTSLASESEAPYYRLNQLVEDLHYHGAPRTGAARLAAVDEVNDARLEAFLRAFPITQEGFLVGVGPRAWPE